MCTILCGLQRFSRILPSPSIFPVRMSAFFKYMQFPIHNNPVQNDTEPHNQSLIDLTYLTSFQITPMLCFAPIKLHQIIITINYFMLLYHFQNTTVISRKTQRVLQIKPAFYAENQVCSLWNQQKKQPKKTEIPLRRAETDMIDNPSLQWHILRAVVFSKSNACKTQETFTCWSYVDHVTVPSYS